MKKYKLKLHYTADELEGLKELRKDYESPINALHQIIIVSSCDDPLRNLRAKYFEIKPEDEFDFMADINNVVMGTAILPNKLYIVHDTNTNSIIYHDYTNNKLDWGPLTFYSPVKNTKEDWLAINPAYEPMLERY